MKTVRVTYLDYQPKYRHEDYEPDDLTVRLVGRTEARERVVRRVKGTRPHMYVPADEPVPRPTEGDEWEILGVEDGYETYDGKPCKRVTVGHPKDVNKIEDEFTETYESDIPYYRRVTWDHNLNGYVRVPEKSTCHIDDIESVDDAEPIDPRVLIADIEVDPKPGQSFDDMRENADRPVISIALWDSYSDEYLVIVVDPEDDIDPGAVQGELDGHWGDHELRDQYVDDAVISLEQVPDETALLQRVVGEAQRRRFDLATGWNFVDFDWDYLIARMKKDGDVDEDELSDIGRVSGYSVESMVEGLPAFDQMRSFTEQLTYGEWRSKALEYVANEEIGIGKIDGISVYDAYRNDRSKLAAYNLLDVQLCVAIDRKHGIEDFFYDLAELSGIQIYDTQYELRLVDGYVGSRREDDEVLPVQKERDIPESGGGLVLTPSTGIVEAVAVLDLRSLYPSTFLSCNISPETMVPLDEADVVVPGIPETEADAGGEITEDDINWTEDGDHLPWSQRAKGFTLDVQGIMPKYLGKMFPTRDSLKAQRDKYDPDDDRYGVYDNRQRGIKIVMNSAFGLTNNPYARWARPGMGDAITGGSRYVLWRAAQYMEDIGYDIVTGDTDSVLVRMSSYDDDRTKEEYILDAKGLQNQLNDFMSTVADEMGIPDEHPYLVDADLHGTDQHCWTFEFEKFYERFIQVGSKKRYAGHLTWKEGKDVDDIDITGFEAVRSDSPEITVPVQRGVIRRVLEDKDFTEISDFVQGKIDDIMYSDLDMTEIGLPWSINKPLSGPDAYGNIPRARGVRFSNEHLDRDFSIGDDVWGYKIKRTPAFVPETDYVALEWYEDDLPEGYELDETGTVEKAFESALTPILEEAGYSFNEVREGRQNQPAADESIMAYVDPFASDDEAEADRRDSTGGAAEW